VSLLASSSQLSPSCFSFWTRYADLPPCAVEMKFQADFFLGTNSLPLVSTDSRPTTLSASSASSLRPVKLSFALSTSLTLSCLRTLTGFSFSRKVVALSMCVTPHCTRHF
jgi:hypothetical protein